MLRRFMLLVCCATLAVGCSSPSTGGDGGEDASPGDHVDARADTVMDATRSDAPASDTPASDTPTADAPAMDAPSTDAPQVDAPAGDVAVDAPAADASMGDVPAADAPLADVPRVDAPADGPLPGCGSSSDCPPSQTCDIPACGERGVCFLRLSCGPIVAPVCGCDNHTYNSACAARNAGVGVASMGACGTTTCTVPPTCCVTDGDCAGSSHCAGSSGVCGAGGTATGVCKPAVSSGCWTDADCTGGQSCHNARVCQCGASCLLPDQPGTCG